MVSKFKCVVQTNPKILYVQPISYAVMNEQTVRIVEIYLKTKADFFY
jgi:hypothetical protein